MSLLRVLHRWAGVAVAAVLAVVALSGVVLLARGPYLRARWPQLATAPATGPLTEYGEVVDALVGRHGNTLTLLKFPQPGANAFHLWLDDGREALVDPRTGVEIASWTARTDPMAFAFDLHAHLLAGETGESTNGVVAVVALLLAASGLPLWWPGRRGAFRLRHAVPRSSAPAALLRSHAALGVFAWLPVVLLTATGAALVFYAAVTPVAAALFDTAPAETPSARVAPKPLPHASWREILRTVESTLPGGTLVYASPGRGGNAVLTFRKRMPGEWHPNGRSYVLVEPYTATLLQTIDARVQGAGTRMLFALYPIHAATIGGVVMTAVAATGGVALAWLAISGTISTARRWLPVRKE